MIRLITIATPSRRAFSHTTFCARGLDPRENPRVDYDASLGDPWYHHRLRNAKALTARSVGEHLRELFRSRRLRICLAVAAAAAAVLFYWYNLEVVPVSGRTRFNCYSEEKMREFGKIQQQVLLHDLEHSGAWLLPPDAPAARMVKRVMKRLVPVAGPAAREEEWEIHVIAEDHLSAANAFVLPGGKVFVYTAMLRVAQTDDQLAAVLSHEIAHNLAQHAAERLSASMGEKLILGGIVTALAGTPRRFLAGCLFGIIALTLLFARPMTRMLESEADYIGLMIMADAYYDPRQAMILWERLRRIQVQMLGEIPEFLSTHPSNQHRIEKIAEWLPEALEKREQSDCRGTQSFAELFRRAMERREVFSRGM